MRYDGNARRVTNHEETFGLAAQTVNFDQIEEV